MIEYVDGAQDESPFFGYLAFTEPHDPLQVPDEWLEPTDHLPDARSVRTAYRDHLLARVLTPHVWLPGGAA